MIMGSVGFQPYQVEDVRTRLRKMSDEELVRSGRPAARLCRPEDQFGHPPRAEFLEQLRKLVLNGGADILRISLLRFHPRIDLPHCPRRHCRHALTRILRSQNPQSLRPVAR